MGNKAALLPASLDQLVMPEVYIAVDCTWMGRDLEFAGTFIGWSEGKLYLQLPDQSADILIPKDSITAVYWAPMGYRPQPLALAGDARTVHLRTVKAERRA